MEPRSPSNATPCWKCHASSPALPRCAACGALQDVPAGADHFALLGFAPALRLDGEALREKFYALTRETHPDRYARSAPPEPMHALRWGTALNRAYQTLREPIARSRYLLELGGRAEAKNSKVPVELAETYFELQDLDDPEQLRAFKRELEAKLAGADAEWEKIADAWPAVQRLEDHLVMRKFLGSMIADIERKL